MTIMTVNSKRKKKGTPSKELDCIYPSVSLGNAVIASSRPQSSWKQRVTNDALCERVGLV